jgi:hypothetical protein
VSKSLRSVHLLSKYEDDISIGDLRDRVSFSNGHTGEFDLFAEKTPNDFAQQCFGLLIGDVVRDPCDMGFQVANRRAHGHCIGTTFGEETKSEMVVVKRIRSFVYLMFAFNFVFKSRGSIMEESVEPGGPW